MTTQTREAIEEARHELTTLHGLLVADGAAPQETWKLDTRRTRERLDAALLNEPCESGSRPS